MDFIQQCFICRPSDSTMSEDAGIEPITVATFSLLLHCKKKFAVFPSQAGMSLTKLSLAKNNLIVNLFYSV